MKAEDAFLSAAPFTQPLNNLFLHIVLWPMPLSDHIVAFSVFSRKMSQVLENRANMLQLRHLATKKREQSNCTFLDSPLAWPRIRRDSLECEVANGIRSVRLELTWIIGKRFASLSRCVKVAFAVQKLLCGVSASSRHLAVWNNGRTTM